MLRLWIRIVGLTVVASTKTCHDSYVIQHGTDETGYMTAFKPLVDRSLKDTVSASRSFRNWFVSESKICQELCVTFAFDQTARTLWRTGQTDKIDALILGDLFSAGIKACYPDPPGNEIIMLAEQMTRAVLSEFRWGADALDGKEHGQSIDLTKPLASDSSVAGHDETDDSGSAIPFHSLSRCKYDGFAGVGKPWIDEFLEGLPKVMENTKQESSVVKEYFETMAFSCQNDCLATVLEQTIVTFWDTGMIENWQHRTEWADDVVGGSVAICYADMPTNVLKELVSHIVKTVPYPQLGSEDKGEFLNRFSALVTDTLAKHARTPAQDWSARTTYKCQEDCLPYLLRESADNLWNSGLLFDEQHKKQYLTESFTHAFHACLPGLAREVASPIVSDLVAPLCANTQFVNTSSAAHSLHRRLGECVDQNSSTPEAQQFFIAFMSAITPSVMENVPSHLQLTSAAKQSQRDCAMKALQKVMVTLWDAGIIADPEAVGMSMVKEAIKGALESCFVEGSPNVLEPMVDTVYGAVHDRTTTTPARPASALPLSQMETTTSTLIPEMGAKCIDPMTIQEGKNQQEFIAHFNPLVLHNLIEVTDKAEHADLKHWLRNKTWDCQKSCLRHMFDESVGTLWGTGQMFDQQNKSALLTEALTGAFKACYPRVPRAHVLVLIDEVVSVVLTSQLVVRRRLELLDHTIAEEFPGGLSGETRRLAFHPCLGWSQTQEGQAWIDSVIKKFPQLLQSTIKQIPDAGDYFKNAKDCQHSCAAVTVRKALANIWDTGIITDEERSHEWAQEAITGALKSCYSSVPREAVFKLVGAMLESMDTLKFSPKEEKVSRLYDEDATVVPITNMRTVSALAAIGIVLGIAMVAFGLRVFIPRSFLLSLARGNRNVYVAAHAQEEEEDEHLREWHQSL